MAHQQSGLRKLLFLGAGVAVLAGCPVPASYSTATSAPVTGRVLWDDGTPARDVPIVLSTECTRSTCGKVALRTTTDAAGSFEVKGSSEHHSAGEGLQEGLSPGSPIRVRPMARAGRRADSAAQRFRIDTTVSLPIDRNKVTDIDLVRLWRREGRWMASLEGHKKSFMNDFARAELIFVLGAPGEAAKVAGP